MSFDLTNNRELIYEDKMQSRMNSYFIGLPRIPNIPEADFNKDYELASFEITVELPNIGPLDKWAQRVKYDIIDRVNIQVGGYNVVTMEGPYLECMDTVNMIEKRVTLDNNLLKIKIYLQDFFFVPISQLVHHRVNIGITFKETFHIILNEKIKQTTAYDLPTSIWRRIFSYLDDESWRSAIAYYLNIKPMVYRRFKYIDSKELEPSIKCIYKELDKVRDQYEVTVKQPGCELVHRCQEDEKEIKGRFLFNHILDYLFIFIKCGKCEDKCSCENKLVKCCLELNTHRRFEHGVEELNVLLPYLGRRLFKKYRKFPKNYFFYPFADIVLVQDIPTLTPGLNATRLDNISVNIKLKGINEGDEVWAVTDANNLFRVVAGMGGIMYAN